MKPVLRQAWRHLRRRPMQSLFFVLGVAIGVAMMVAIDLANGSAQRAFELSADTVAGRTTHQISGGPTGMDEQLFTAVRVQAGWRLSAPIVEEYVTVPALDSRPMRLLGVDPFAEGPFRTWLGLGDQAQAPDATWLAELMARPATTLLSSDVAARYGLEVGDTLEIHSGADVQTLTVVGLLQPSDDLSRRALDSLLITDIATAQEVLGREGRVDRIDLILPEGEAEAAALAQIQAVLPPSARIEPTAARQGAVAEMTAAFSLNLTALSLLALVVGLFLIYNTVTFGVVQQRPVLGSLRALGMTRAQIFSLVLIEAGALGVLGTLLGLALGILLGRSLVGLVTQTVNDLFFVVAVREVTIPGATLVKGAAAGVLAALAGAAIPAWEATTVPPAGALRRSNVEARTRLLLPWITGAGVALLALGGLLMIPEESLALSFAGLFAAVLGAALLTPALLLLIMAPAEWLLRRLGLVARLAPRTVKRSLSRTAVAVAALMVAVSVIIGVGVMIASFRATVVEWLDDILQADIYVFPPSLQSNQVLTALEPGTAGALAALPGIAHTATTRNVQVSALLPGRQEAVPVQIAALSEDLAGRERRYRAALGSPAETWQAVRAGAVVINEPMANRYNLGVGDRFQLQTNRGLLEVQVAGVNVDFDVAPSLLMDDAVYRRLFDDDGISAVGLFVEQGRDVDEMVAYVQATFAGQEQLLVRSNAGMRTDALAVFDRTFAITAALQLLATLVAFIGILSTLMSLQLERVREIGVLRAMGMTRRQLWRLSLLETGLIGGAAGLVALPTGLLLAVVLIYIINLRSFGWTLQLQMAPQIFVQAFAVALGAALLAGLYPAWRMGKTQPAVAVRSE